MPCPLADSMDPLALHARPDPLPDLFSPLGKADPFILPAFPLPSMATHSASPGSIDPDDDFGEFEFVPANALDPDRPSISFPDIPTSDSIRNSQSSSGMRDLFEVSSNARSTSTATDLFGLPTAAPDTSHFPPMKENGNLFEVNSWKMESVANRNYVSDDIFGHISSLCKVSGVSAYKGNDNTVTDDAMSFSSKITDNPLVSDDLFGDFSTVTSADKVTSVEITSDVLGMAVGEDFFGQFSGTSVFQSSKQSTDLERGNEKQLEASSDDDWGDFVTHSTLPADGNFQEFRWVDKIENNPEGHVLNPASLAEGFDTLSAEMTNEHVQQHIASGIPRHDMNEVSNVNGKSDMSPEMIAEDYCKDGTGKTQLSSGLHRTQSENLMSQKRRGSLIDSTSAPIPLSLFGEEEPKDEPLQPDSQNFQGHSKARYLSKSLPSAHGMNITDLIASLYTVPEPESQGKDVSHLSKEENEQDQTFNNGSLFVVDEECLFDLTLATSLKQFEDGSAVSTASVEDKHLFVKAWADVLAVCEAELEYASNVWKQAHNDGLEVALLADIQGKKYFAAIGQIYIVALMLASSLNVYKPWLAVASKESEKILASLHGCKVAWLQTNLREAVQFSLHALKNTLPSSVFSWEGIQNFPSHAKSACEQAANVSEHSDRVCKLSLLPFIPFHYTGVQTVQWSGSTYFLPMANVWANCVSDEPPMLPSLQSTGAQ